jgi:hypothetical protein
MMKLYFLATDMGCAEFLFAEDEERAVEVFSIYAVLARLRLSRFWFRELVPDALPSPTREQLTEALASRVEGFGRFDENTGWAITPAQQRFDELAAEGEGAAA